MRGALKSLLALARLTRVSTSLVAAIVVFALRPDLDGALAASALALALAAGFAFNDVRDHAADATNVPTRPIPSGAISATAATSIAIACAAGAGIAAIFTTSARVIGLTSALTLLLFAYSLWLKPILGVKNVVMALVGASVPLFAGISPQSQALAAAIGLFILQKEIVADVYDRDGDARVHLRTLPIVFGVRGALLIVIAVNLGFIAVSSVALASPVNAALAAVGVFNVVAATTVLLPRGPIRVLHFLRFQQAFLLAGVLLVWL